MITIEEIKEKMHLHKVNITMLADAFRIEKGTISSHLSGRHSSRLFKIACYFYFETLRLEKLKGSE